ncbi:glycerol-3-phosphate dehydrogenase/oxidase [Alicyclobacillus tolerans]|uniref:Aerobic glycerol-3-phosphate dehydrogenase n=1 Tax=Alicyclobacillus tolerans TaxID=90970 RepID=A0A1M6PMT2_9BACL|nr:FAD-dependent oxidoreductase [Alicyclobacillus montanus]SHK09227.1 homodimeric glycerol 3-phosphate dehydrogenase (quinone) [Alicyclobacillus montanus]
MAIWETELRPQLLHKMQANEWDVLIIGGGITGAGILLDAVSRGLKAALIEMQDFAAGTSNRSTKLIHGGLRYLKQLEIGLVAEVGRERAVVYENAPHVTRPEWMLLPLMEGGTYGKLAASFGIRLYDYLAGVKRTERRQMLSREEALAKEPLLNPDGLKGAGYYVEYRTDDARLTLEVLKKAVQLGGVAINYCKALQLIKENGQLLGIHVQDELQPHHSFDIRARVIINATGPWVDEIRDWDHSKQGKTLHWTKGVHIVVDASRFPLSNPVYFDVPDGRMIFAIPRSGKTYIGTTDTNYTGDVMYPRMTLADRDYLLEAVNTMFPSVRLLPEDVESSWAGIRPLIHEDGKNPSEISRKDEIFQSSSGLITIAGGKLTGYRKMAEKVVDIVVQRIGQVTGQTYPGCQTEHLRLSGGEFHQSSEWNDFVHTMTREGELLGLSSQEARQLVERYGKNVERVFNWLRNEPLDAGLAIPKDIYAALQYGLEEEMVCRAEDFFIRRTGSLYFNMNLVLSYQHSVVDFMAKRLQWSDDRVLEEKQRLQDRILEAREALEKPVEKALSTAASAL